MKEALSPPSCFKSRRFITVIENLINKLPYFKLAPYFLFGPVETFSNYLPVFVLDYRDARKTQCLHKDTPTNIDCKLRADSGVRLLKCKLDVQYIAQTEFIRQYDFLRD